MYDEPSPCPFPTQLGLLPWNLLPPTTILSKAPNPQPFQCPQTVQRPFPKPLYTHGSSSGPRWWVMYPQTYPQCTQGKEKWGEMGENGGKYVKMSENGGNLEKFGGIGIFSHFPPFSPIVPHSPPFFPPLVVPVGHPPPPTCHTKVVFWGFATRVSHHVFPIVPH